MLERRISKAQFKAKALELLRQVEETGEAIVVTDHGRPAIEVRPYRDPAKNPLDKLKGSVQEYHDPTLPVSEDDWESL